MKLWKHMRALWPRYTLGPVLPFALWTLFCIFDGRARWDHLALTGVVAGLAYTGPRTKKLFLGLLPIGLVALFYDAMHLVQNVGLSESTVHVCDLRAAEMKWFGVTVDGVRMTWQDYFYDRWHIAIDALCAFPYAAFIPVIVLYAIYLYTKDFKAQQRFTWSFLLLNIVGFATYHIYPAAPPWYFHAYGCTVDLTAHASEGTHLARVDALMGIEYFKSFYGRSADVFGAVPSLHVAYPLTIVLEGWRRHRPLGRALSIFFYLWMCFSAVYLDHHWVIDVLLGSAYACAAVVVVRWAFSRVEALADAPLPAANLGETR